LATPSAGRPDPAGRTIAAAAGFQPPVLPGLPSVSRRGRRPN
jgi:hypothetical protein